MQDPDPNAFAAAVAGHHASATAHIELDLPWPGLDAGTLYWGENGQISCGRHAPRPGSDTWATYRWREMTAEEIAGFLREVSRRPDCELCAARRRRGQS